MEPTGNTTASKRWNAARPALSPAVRRLAVALATLHVVGCGGNDGLRLVDAGGSVTFNGNPLANAQIVFAPDSKSRVAYATTDEEGEFRLGTIAPGDGALVGRHRVSVIARGPAKPPEPGSPGALMPDEYPVLGDPLIPEKYFTAVTSGLTAEVVAGGDNLFVFSLADQVVD